MSKCFADTAYFLALLSPADVAHTAAAAYARAPAQHIVTTSAVLLELGGHLCRPADRPLFTGLFDDLGRNAGFRMVLVDEALLDAGMQLFRERPDKNWSLTDCISFAVMRADGIIDAATTDQHFRQAGFNVLLPVSA